MFMQFYITQFPTAGEVVIFDRSWYNRAGEAQDELFLDLCSEIERYVVDGGITLIKISSKLEKRRERRLLPARWATASS